MRLDSGRPTWLGEGPHRGSQGPEEARSAVVCLPAIPTPVFDFPSLVYPAKMDRVHLMEDPDQSRDPVPGCNLKMVVGAQFWAILAGAFPGIREPVFWKAERQSLCVGLLLFLLQGGRVGKFPDGACFVIK